MLVRDILNLKGGAIHGIEASAPLTEAVSRMVQLDIGSLVVREGEAMRGMLTFREVLRALDSSNGALGHTIVSEVMETASVCATPADTIDELRELMTRHHVRYVPVKQGTALVGVISFHDVAKAAIMETRLENRLLKRYIETEPESIRDRP